MLVLGRRPGESIRIGKDIQVCITHVDLQTGYVKLGFTAPSDVVIDREEIYQRKLKDLCAPSYLSEDDTQCPLKHNTKP